MGIICTTQKKCQGFIFKFTKNVLLLLLFGKKLSSNGEKMHKEKIGFLKSIILYEF